MHSLFRFTWRTRRGFSRAVRWLPLSRSVSYLEVESKFLPASDFLDGMNSLCSTQDASKIERFRDTYYDNGILAKKGIWIRYRRTTSVGTEDDEPVADLPSDECWNAKVRLGGDFIESQFEEHHGEGSIRDLLSTHIPGTMLEDLAITADLETTRTTWSIRLHDSYSHANSSTCNDAEYMSVALDHVVSLKEEPACSQLLPKFEHLVGEVELVKPVSTASEDEDVAVESEMELDQMKSRIGEFMKDNPRLFSQSKPVGKLSAYFDWERRSLAAVQSDGG